MRRSSRCLEATEDPLGSEDLRRDLLCGFDRLSGVLEREGIPAEALDVVDSAASLGLLDGEYEADREHLDALMDRRESSAPHPPRRLRPALTGRSGPRAGTQSRARSGSMLSA